MESLRYGARIVCAAGGGDEGVFKKWHAVKAKKKIMYRLIKKSFQQTFMPNHDQGTPPFKHTELVKKITSLFQKEARLIGDGVCEGFAYTLAFSSFSDSSFEKILRGIHAISRNPNIPDLFDDIGDQKLTFLNANFVLQCIFSLHRAGLPFFFSLNAERPFGLDFSVGLKNTLRAQGLPDKWTCILNRVVTLDLQLMQFFFVMPMLIMINAPFSAIFTNENHAIVFGRNKDRVFYADANLGRIFLDAFFNKIQDERNFLILNYLFFLFPFENIFSSGVRPIFLKAYFIILKIVLLIITENTVHSKISKFVFSQLDTEKKANFLDMLECGIKVFVNEEDKNNPSVKKFIAHQARLPLLFSTRTGSEEKCLSLSARDNALEDFERYRLELEEFPDKLVSSLKDAISNAMYYGQAEASLRIAFYLHQAGVNLNIPLSSERGHAILHSAVIYRNPLITKWLIEFNLVDVNTLDKYGISAIEYAAAGNCINIMSILLNTGKVELALIRNALELAANNKNFEVINIIIGFLQKKDVILNFLLDSSYKKDIVMLKFLSQLLVFQKNSLAKNIQHIVSKLKSNENINESYLVKDEKVLVRSKVVSFLTDENGKKQEVSKGRLNFNNKTKKTISFK